MRINRVRGSRATRGMVEMVRDQVKVLTASQGRMAKSIDALRVNIRQLNAGMDEMGNAFEAMNRDVSSLAKALEMVASKVDEEADQHESFQTDVLKRLEVVERKIAKK